MTGRTIRSPLNFVPFVFGALLLLGGSLFLLPRGGWAGEEQVQILTLEQTLQIVLEKNKDIQKAREFRNSLEGRYVEERAAALPQLKLSANVIQSRDESQQALVRGLFPLENQTRTGQVSLSQALYTFGQVGAAIRAAKIGLGTAEDQLRLFQQAALRDASASFYDILLAKELHHLAGQTLEQKKRLLDEARRRHAAGVATDYDILAAEVAVENARPEVIRRENGIQTSRDRLRFLLGMDGREVDAEGGLSPSLRPEPPYGEAIQTAWQNRPELADKRKRIEVARELVKIADAGDKPRVDFRADYGWRELILGEERGNGQIWSAGVFLSFPFFDGLKTQGKVAQAKSDMNTLKIEEAKLQDSISLEVRDALQSSREAAEIIRALSGTVKQAERLLRMAEKGYELGVKTKLDVDDAELNLTLAKGNLARAQRDYVVAQVNLDWVTGMLGEKKTR